MFPGLVPLPLTPPQPGKSLNDMHVECVENKKFKQYVSKSHVVNAFMVAPTTLLYTIPFSKKNFAKVRELSMNYRSNLTLTLTPNP